MFKKRGITKPGENKNQGGNQEVATFSKRLMTGGIDLRRDIEQLQTNIKQNKNTNEFGKHQNYQQKQDHQQGGSYNNESYHHHLPKTKKINKFTSHIMNKLPTISTNNNNANTIASNTQQRPLRQLHKESQHVKEQEVQQDIRDKKEEGLVKPVLANYGLLDKSHFKQTQSKTQVIQQSKTHQQALMDYYIKKKMQQLTNKTTSTTKISNTTNNNSSNLPSNPSNTYTLKQRPTQTWEEVLHIQNQYLTQQEKIKQYSIEEIQKKLQKQAHQIIKSEIEKRNFYLKDLLENQYERMEYASKKQLKIIKQQKQRIQKQLNSKYKDTGRRHYIDSIKNSVL